MSLFTKFNPFEASAKVGAAPTNDPRTAPVTPAQQEPIRGVPVPASTDTTQPDSSKKSPVDILEEVWQTELKPDTSSVQVIKPEQISELSSKFTPTFDAAEIEAAQSDPAKFAELMTKVARQSFEKATAVNSALASNYLEQDRAALETRTKTHLTKSSVMDAVAELNPALTSSGPFKDMTANLVSKYLTKYPDKSPKEIAADIDAFVATKLGTQKPAATETKPEDEPAKKTNWMEFLEG